VQSANLARASPFLNQSALHGGGTQTDVGQRAFKLRIGPARGSSKAWMSRSNSGRLVSIFLLPRAAKLSTHTQLLIGAERQGVGQTEIVAGGGLPVFFRARPHAFILSYWGGVWSSTLLTMQLTLEDDLVSAARLTEAQARLTLALNLFAEDRLTLAQTARLSGLDRLAFQRELAAWQIPRHYGEEELSSDLAANGDRHCENAQTGNNPWMALRGSACFVGDPFAPVVSEEEIVVLQKVGSSVGS
jgi:predicted HTH domain antitoxin